MFQDGLSARGLVLSAFSGTTHSHDLPNFRKYMRTGTGLALRELLGGSKWMSDDLLKSPQSSRDPPSTRYFHCS